MYWKRLVTALVICVAAMHVYAQDATVTTSPQSTAPESAPAAPAPRVALVYRSSLPLQAARRIALAIEAKAQERKSPVAVAILDDAGDVKLAYVMDGEGVMSLEWAKAKALTAHVFKKSTNKGEFRVWNIDNKTMVLGVAGGHPLMINNQLVGAIGVSGTRSEDDDLIAQAGLDEFNKLFK